MANRVNLKVSEVTHEALEAEKQEGESFDDTLRRVLGLEPEHVDVDDLAAYFPEKLRTKAHDLVDIISDLADFEIRVERDANDGYDHIRFAAPESGITIAQVRFGEELLMTDYRSRTGDMKKISSVRNAGNKDYGLSLNIEDDWDEIKKEHKKKIEGAYRKWSGSG
jgi:hypothetical protein